MSEGCLLLMQELAATSWDRLFDPITIQILKREDGTRRLHIAQGRDFKNALETIQEKLNDWSRVRAPLERLLKLRQGVIDQVRADWKRLAYQEFKEKYKVSTKGHAKLTVTRFRAEFPGPRGGAGKKNAPGEGKSPGAGHKRASRMGARSSYQPSDRLN